VQASRKRTLADMRALAPTTRGRDYLNRKNRRDLRWAGSPTFDLNNWQRNQPASGLLNPMSKMCTRWFDSQPRDHGGGYRLGGYYRDDTYNDTGCHHG